MELPRVLSAVIAAVILLASISVLYLFTLGARPLPTASGVEPANAPPLSPGSYLGWRTDSDARFALQGVACRAGAAGGAADDYMVSLLLSGPQQQQVVPAQMLSSYDLDFGPYGPVPVLQAELNGGGSWQFNRAVLRCRSGAEFATALGTAEVLAVSLSEADVILESVAQYASERLFGELLIHNRSAEPLQLSSVRYAPAGRSSGWVRAAAGSYAHLPLWRSNVYDPLLAPFAPAAISPWDAAFQHPDDPRRLLQRSADAIGLAVHPGELAVIYLELDSLLPSRRREPVLVYPVVDILTQNGEEQLAATEPMFIWSPSR